MFIKREKKRFHEISFEEFALNKSNIKKEKQSKSFLGNTLLKKRGRLWYLRMQDGVGRFKKALGCLFFFFPHPMKKPVF